MATVVTLGLLVRHGGLPARPGVTKINFDCIEKGMTKAQVEEIFGRKGKRRLGLAEKATGFNWTANDGSLVLVVFVDECVYEKQWADSENGQIIWILDKL